MREREREEQIGVVQDEMQLCMHIAQLRANVWQSQRAGGGQRKWELCVYGCSVREMKLRRQYKADHIMYHTCQWSMKQESHCSVNHNAQHACKQTEGWPGYLKRNVTVFKTFPLKTHTSMLLRTTESKLSTGRDNFTEPR